MLSLVIFLSEGIGFLLRPFRQMILELIGLSF